MSHQDDGITLNYYQEKGKETAVYPGQNSNKGFNYTIVGLAGEAGETCNKWKKILRRGDGLRLADVALFEDELGDVLWYVAAAARELGLPLSQIAEKNLEKLAKRQAEDKLKEHE